MNVLPILAAKGGSAFEDNSLSRIRKIFSLSFVAFVVNNYGLGEHEII